MAKGKQRKEALSPITDPETAGYFRSYRRIIMYEDLNSASTLFGGRLASWIDEGSAIFASCQMNARRIVTRKISELVFHRPAKLGDMLEIWCKVLRKGSTSITIGVIVSRRSFADDPARAKNPDSAEICRCEIVFVCLDEKGQPKVWNA
ncbi:MAG: acyl-CoA thioesterase [Bdellovibrionales bacterium]|nr:acyl-CoA thioesterase [Bdellovibrionales bacterium]